MFSIRQQQIQHLHLNKIIFGRSILNGEFNGWERGIRDVFFRDQGSKSRLIPVRLGQVVSTSTMAGTGPIPELDNQHFLLSLQIQMDFFNQFCNSYPFPSDSHSVSTPESSSASDWQTRRTIQSDEEVLRASDRPKKRVSNCRDGCPGA